MTSQRKEAEGDLIRRGLGASTERLIHLSCASLILIHLIASFFPGLRLWGINQLHYFSLEFRIAVSAAGLLILVPKMNKILARVLAGAFGRIADRFKKMNKYLIYSAISVLSLIPFWLLRARTPLLGDGYLRAGELKLGILISIAEPLDFYLHLFFFNLLGLDGYTTYGLLSCMAGALYVFLILALCDLWGRDGTEKLLVFSILASMGATQLFFGYVESYSFMYVALTAYLLFSMRYLKGTGGFLWPSLFLLLAVGFHLSALFVLPSLFYLGLAKRPELTRSGARGSRFVNVVVLVCVLSLLWLGVYLLKAYSPQAAASSLLIHPFGAPESYYSFFSPAHLLDFLNHQLLISPISLVLCLVILILWRWINVKENVVRFLIWVMVCSFAFALLVDPKLGYARDWDLFAVTGLGAGLLGLYLVVDVFRTLRDLPEGGDGRQTQLSRVTLALAVTSLILNLPWILANASEEKSIARLEHLLIIDEKRAAHGYEIMACYFRDRGQDQKTIELWEKAIGIDSIPRYFAALGNTYGRLKRYHQAIEAYDRSIQMEPDGPVVYLLHRSLGLCLARVGRYEEAITQLQRAVRLRPEKSEYYYSLGNILGKVGRYEEAVANFEMALKLDPRNVAAYKGLGISCAAMGQKLEARTYLERYLKSVPGGDPGIKGIIDSIEIEIEYDR